jgi:hypothetical protein
MRRLWIFPTALFALWRLAACTGDDPEIQSTPDGGGPRPGSSAASASRTRSAKRASHAPTASCAFAHVKTGRRPPTTRAEMGQVRSTLPLPATRSTGSRRDRARMHEQRDPGRLHRRAVCPPTAPRQSPTTMCRAPACSETELTVCDPTADGGPGSCSAGKVCRRIDLLADDPGSTLSLNVCLSFW